MAASRRTWPSPNSSFSLRWRPSQSLIAAVWFKACIPRWLVAPFMAVYRGNTRRETQPRHARCRRRERMSRVIRSLLYVPASSERFVAKAAERGADAIILDLEDAVAPSEKVAARSKLAGSVPAVGRNGATVFVRINSEPELMRADAEAAVRAGAFGLLVPKSRDPKALVQLGQWLEPLEKDRKPAVLAPMIEDPGAVLDARAIASATPRVFAMLTGGEDLATALGGEPTPEVLTVPKLLVHYAAKAAGVLSWGLLRTVADYSDLGAIEKAAREARAHGIEIGRAHG